MPRVRSILVLAFLLAQLVLAAAPLWHHHEHEHEEGGHDEEAACAVCHAVTLRPQADLPAPTVVGFAAPRVGTLRHAAEADSAALFVRDARARGPPRA